MIKSLADRFGVSPAMMRPIVSTTLMMVATIAITANLALGGFLLKVDLFLANLDYRLTFSAPMPFADWSDRIGQRAVCLPLLFLLTFVIWRRYGFKRPIVIAVLGNLGLNFVVGVLKLATSRESPRTGIPDFFVGNVLFPSGHSGNVIFVYGLMAAFALRYALVHPRRKPVLTAGVAGLTVLMFIISIYRETHWFTDLVVGALLGGIALECALLVDRQWPWVRSVAERMLGAMLRVVARFARTRYPWPVRMDLPRGGDVRPGAEHRSATQRTESSSVTGAGGETTLS